MKDFDIEKVWFTIRKSTPKLYDRLSIYKQKNGTYKITLTSYDGVEFEFYGENAIKYLSAFINHEFLHVILSECIFRKCSKDYDELLKAFKKYTNDKIMRDWI